MQEFLNNAILVPLQNLLNQVYSFLPNFFAMLLILIVGYFIAFFFKKFLIIFLKLIKFDRLSFRMGFDNILAKAGIRRKSVEVLAIFVYWILLFVFLMLALNALKVKALDTLISQFFLFIPNLFAGFVLFFLGYLTSVFLERAVLIAAVNAELQFARFLARGVQILVLCFFLAISLEQIGIGENIVIATFTIIFGGVVLALALALGLGGQKLGQEWLEKKLTKKESGKEEKDMWSHI
jgi:hypothetical protein